MTEENETSKDPPPSAAAAGAAAAAAAGGASGITPTTSDTVTTEQPQDDNNKNKKANQGDVDSGSSSSEQPDIHHPLLETQQQQEEEEQEQEDQSDDDETSLVEISRVNDLLVKASNLSILCFISMVALVYGLTPRQDWKYLDEAERYAASLACGCLAIAVFLSLLPFSVTRGRANINGVIYAALVTQFVSLLTNGIMAFLPTVVLVDDYTHARVYLMRFCEWVPLAGLMTFFSEAIELPQQPRRARVAMWASVSQSASCLFGMLLPCCHNIYAWLTVMTLSVSTFLVIFPRVAIKKKRFRQAKKGSSFLEQEQLDRIRFAYLLMFICSIVWTLLVVMYFLNMMTHRLLPPNHVLRFPGLSMAVDTLFDVIAKALYLKLIVDIHFCVFDNEGRAQRQLAELRNLYSVLWHTSSDVICVSVRQKNIATSMLSPSFGQLVGAPLPSESKNMALLLETTFPKITSVNEATTSQPSSNCIISSAMYVDSTEIPYSGMLHRSILGYLESDSHHATCALQIVQNIWEQMESDDQGSNLSVLSFKKANGEDRKSEIKVSKYRENAAICVIRDVTERYRRFEAEQRAHAETLARQKEAQSQSRFVRHEVKNGILSSLELCDSIRSSMYQIDKALGEFKEIKDSGLISQKVEDCSHTSQGALLSLEDLNMQLYEILDTALAEAIARDVIHERYTPRLEQLDVAGLLRSKMGKSGRFVLKVSGSKLPFLRLDPQIIQYIHRNAVSNASKYGDPTGSITSILSFDEDEKLFTMQVVNKPGAYHSDLVKLDRAARDAVFSQGNRLQVHNTEDHFISSGDGAWIMQKCARTLSGCCSIDFESDRTVFTFKCKCEAMSDLPEAEDFAVPPGTWGIGVDDSMVQRKLMGKILSHAGVDPARTILLGKSLAEVSSLESVLLDTLEQHEESKVLVLMDENLDYNVEGGQGVVMSGSLVMKSILDRMMPEKKSRVLSLVRSANDSAEEIELYCSRTNGFFPKAPMKRDRVRVILAPIWFSYFQKQASKT